MDNAKARDKEKVSIKRNMMEFAREKWQKCLAGKKWEKQAYTRDLEKCQRALKDLWESHRTNVHQWRNKKSKQTTNMEQQKKPMNCSKREMSWEKDWKDYQTRRKSCKKNTKNWEIGWQTTLEKTESNKMVREHSKQNGSLRSWNN